MTAPGSIDPDAYAGLVAMTGGDDEFLGELIETYASDGEDQVSRLRTAVAKGDMSALVIAAHSLKSNSANVGALRLAELCRALEADGRAGVVPDANERVSEIASAFEQARSTLHSLRGAG